MNREPRQQSSAITLMLVLWLSGAMTAAPWPVVGSHAADSGTSAEDLEIEVNKKGLGKEVFIRKGPKEWFMMIEVTPENTVVIRQVKDNETYLLDESETHDRAMSAGEVDTAINDFINSVKAEAKRK